MRPRVVTLAAAVALLVLPSVEPRAAETFSVDPAHSNVTFRIRHLVSWVTGSFRTFQGTVLLDRQEMTRSSATLTIATASVDTGAARRDEDLRSKNFFEVAAFPEMTFKSARIEKTGDSTYRVTGTFAMHGVTKEIAIPVEFLGTAKDPWGGERAGFSTSFTLDRKDYGMTWNKTLDSGGVLVGDEVRIEINLETVRQADPAKPKP